MEVYKQTNHLQTPLTTCSIHQQNMASSSCLHWGILTICCVCTCRSSLVRSLEYREPTRMVQTLCRWQNTPEPRIGKKSPETKPNVYNLDFSFKPCNLTKTHHNSTVDRVGIILAVVKNWAAPGRPPLSHRSLTLGLRSSGKIDESAPPIIINRSALHPASQCLSQN